MKKIKDLQFISQTFTIKGMRPRIYSMYCPSLGRGYKLEGILKVISHKIEWKSIFKHFRHKNNGGRGYFGQPYFLMDTFSIHMRHVVLCNKYGFFALLSIAILITFLCFVMLVVVWETGGKSVSFSISTSASNEWN